MMATIKCRKCIGNGEGGSGCRETEHTCGGYLIQKTQDPQTDDDGAELVFICERCAENELEHIPN
jgi:hypothetical protein